MVIFNSYVKLPEGNLPFRILLAILMLELEVSPFCPFATSVCHLCALCILFSERIVDKDNFRIIYGGYEYHIHSSLRHQELGWAIWGVYIHA